MDVSEYLKSRKDFSVRRMHDLKSEIESDPEFQPADELCIYITGSFGRKEAHADSDLDLFFVQRGEKKENKISYVEKALMDASVIRSCRKLKFPEFTKGGIYLEVHYLKDILNVLGSPDDDHLNYFTARMLLILESIPICNDNVYDDSVSDIILTYYRDYHEHENNFKPVFLLNDIHRYWRTMCLNYEHIRNRKMNMSDKEKNKSHLKNLKLKFSRLLTCYSMIISIMSLPGSVGHDDIKSLVYKSPMERLWGIVQARKELRSLVEGIVGDYAWFLEKTGVNEERALEWISDRGRRDEAFERGREFGRKIHSLVTQAPSDKDLLRYLIV